MSNVGKGEGGKSKEMGERRGGTKEKESEGMEEGGEEVGGKKE